VLQPKKGKKKKKEMERELGPQRLMSWVFATQERKKEIFLVALLLVL